MKTDLQGLLANLLSLLLVFLWQSAQKCLSANIFTVEIHSHICILRGSTRCSTMSPMHAIPEEKTHACFKQLTYCLLAAIELSGQNRIAITAKSRHYIISLHIFLRYWCSPPKQPVCAYVMLVVACVPGFLVSTREGASHPILGQLGKKKK